MALSYDRSGTLGHPMHLVYVQVGILRLPSVERLFCGTGTQVVAHHEADVLQGPPRGATWSPLPESEQECLKLGRVYAGWSA